MGLKDLIKQEKELLSKPGMIELRQQLNRDVKSLFRTGAKYLIFIAIPKLRNTKKLTSDMFTQFAANLNEFLILADYDFKQIEAPKKTKKNIDELIKEINYTAAVKSNRLFNKAVVVSAANGWFNMFNTLTEKENIVELIPLLYEMSLALQ